MLAWKCVITSQIMTTIFDIDILNVGSQWKAIKTFFIYDISRNLTFISPSDLMMLKLEILSLQVLHFEIWSNIWYNIWDGPI